MMHACAAPHSVACRLSVTLALRVCAQAGGGDGNGVLLNASHAAHAAGMFACGRHVSRVGRASRGREISIVMRC